MTKPKAHPFPYRLVIAGAVIVVGLAIGFALTEPGQLIGSSKLQVVAAENPWGNIAAQIGGNQVQVTSILNDPNADPHLYESDARDAESVARAQVVIKNGLGYDDFIDHLLAGSGTSGKIIVDAQSVARASADANPHLWYDPTLIPTVAQSIETALAAKRPASSAYFKANLVRFDASLAPIATAISSIKQSYAGEPVAYTERVPGYMLAQTGLTVATPPGFAIAIEDGTEPSPSDYHAMEDLILGHRIRVLLYNEQATSSTTSQIRTLAKVAGIPVVGVTETLPVHDNYQSWQLSQIKALQAALRQ